MDIRHTHSGRRRAATVLQLVLTVALTVPAAASAERIKDIASVAGVRSNPLIGYGLGRVGFWGAGTDPEALGELLGWTDFPGLFAGTMRWLLPRAAV